MTCLIDLDGTILNIWNRYYAILNDSFIAGYLEIDELINKYVYILMRREGLSEEMFLKLIGVINTEAYLNHRQTVIESEHYLSFDTLFDIEKLKKFDRRILITYRKNRKNLINQLKKLGIHYFFTEIITPKSSISAKEFKFEIICELGENERINALDCIVIGDTETDILAAKKNKIYSIGVLSGMTNRACMQNIKPDRIIENISEL